MSVAVKTYLNVSLPEPEIRRFSVDSDASTSFDYLVEKIRNVYPNLKRVDFQLFWKDEDKELITFSSDDELIEALTHVQGEFFRVYVKEKQSSAKSGEVHPHVECDSCDGAVVGSRFKCIVCPDYDLCNTCEAKGIHAQHNLIRIRTPESAPSFPWFMNMPFWPGQQMGRGGCGGRRGRQWRGPPHGFRRGRGPWHGACPRGGVPFECPPGNTTAPEATEGEKTEENTTGNEPAAFFHQFGEALNSFLGPFGVDVHTFADNNQDEPGQCGQHNEKSSCPQPPSEGETTSKSHEDVAHDEPMDEVLSPPTTGDHTYVVVEQNDSPADTTLADAIAQMKTMGFDDEGGWLSQLLKAKNYDINKVLDAIQHPQKKQ